MDLEPGVRAAAHAAAHAAALWSGLLLWLMVGLAVLVVRQRARHKVLIGDGDIPELVRAIRAFGNAAEYVPAGIAALAVLVVAGAPALVAHGVGAALLAGRLAHAVGISRSAATSAARAGGTVLTWLAFLFAGATLLVYAVP